MSGQKKDPAPIKPEQIKSEANEIAIAAQRTLKLLRRRAEIAKRRVDRNPGNEALVKNYLYSAQEFWAVTKVINLAMELGKQVNVLQGLLETLVDRDDALAGAEEVFRKMAADVDKKKPN